MSHDRKSVITASAEVHCTAHTKDTDDKRKNKGKRGIMPGLDPKRGIKGRRKAKLKDRSHVRKPLQVKEDDANLRLTTDLPRFNWLAMKINQKSPSVALVKRDVKHKILATVTETQPEIIKDSPAESSVASPTVLMETGDSCSVSAETTVTFRTETKDPCSRWPLKKRVIRFDCQVTAANSNSPTVQQSPKEKESAGEEEAHPALLQPIVIEIKLPPVELINGDSPAVPSAARADQDQPLDLSKTSDCKLIPRTRLPKEQCSVIRSTKVELSGQQIQRFPRETSLRDSRRESLLRISKQSETRIPHQIDEIHRPERRLCGESNQHSATRPARTIPVWNPAIIPESQQTVAVLNAHRESISSDIEYLGRYQRPRVIRPKPRKLFYTPYQWDYWFCFHCRTCGKRAGFRCPGCRTSAYCSESCQRIDWPNHNLLCAMARS